MNLLKNLGWFLLAVLSFFFGYGLVQSMALSALGLGASIYGVLSLYIALSGAYVYGVSTVPKFERNGYARKLLQYVMETLKEMGIKRIELTVDMDNFTAKKIYEELGFKIVETLDNEYGDNVERYLMRYLVK